MIDDIENREFSPATRKKILFATLFSLMIGNMMIQNVVSFLPIFIA
jgi:MFS family permease